MSVQAHKIPTPHQWMQELVDRGYSRNAPSIGVEITVRIPLQGGRAMVDNEDVQRVLETAREYGAAEITSLISLSEKV